MLKLYGRNTSINVQKAAWAIAEARLDWDWVDRYGSVGSIDSVEYRKINPAAQIPTLCDNELLIRQSNTIVRYIAKTYSKSSLWPQNVNEYIEAERWMDWQAIDNWKNLGIVFWGLIRTPKSERNNKSIFQATEALISDFLLLNDRYLLGSGIRIGFNRNLLNKTYLGMGFMLERETYNLDIVNENKSSSNICSL